MKLTTFIIGAGASTDFQFPTGEGLANMIREKLLAELAIGAERPIFRSAMRAGLEGDLGAAARDIAGGMIVARSIDRFLDTRWDSPLVGEIGKRAIAASIAEYERRSHLGAVDSVNAVAEGKWSSVHRALIETRASWIALLFGALSEGVTPSNAETVLKDCRFVIFNYDRCVERYLQLAFEHMMNQSSLAAAILVSRLPIIHVYGSLGPLPMTAPGVEYAAPDTQLDRMASSLRTFTEASDAAVLERVRGFIEEADRLVYLGFGFDDLNIKALHRGPLRSEQQFMATALGLGGQRQAAFGGTISNRGRQGFMVTSAKDLIQLDEFRAFIEI